MPLSSFSSPSSIQARMFRHLFVQAHAARFVSAGSGMYPTEPPAFTTNSGSPPQPLFHPLSPSSFRPGSCASTVLAIVMLSPSTRLVVTFGSSCHPSAAPLSLDVPK